MKAILVTPIDLAEERRPNRRYANKPIWNRPQKTALE